MSLMMVKFQVQGPVRGLVFVSLKVYGVVRVTNSVKVCFRCEGGHNIEYQ